MVKNYIEKLIDYYKFWHIGLSEWRRVIYALIYRETKTTWGQHSLGILWGVTEPITHIFVFAFLRSALKGGEGNSGELSMLLFIATGIFPFFIFRDVFNKTKACISANRALLVFPQIRILDFVFARSILELMTSSTAFLLFIIGLSWFEDAMPISVIKIMVGVLLMWILGIGCGLLCLPLHGRFKFIDEIISVSTRILYFISGVMFSFTDIPQSYHQYLSWIPTFHGIEYIRSGFSYVYGEFADIQYLFYTAFISLLFGMLIVRQKQNYILSVR